MAYDEFDIPAPASGSVTDFTFCLPYSRFSASWQAAVDTTDATRARFYKGDGVTELPFDAIMPNGVWDSSAYFRFKWSGTLTSVSTETVRVEPPLAAVSQYATPTDAYDANWAIYSPDCGDDRTSNGHIATAQAGVSIGGVAGKVGTGTDFDGSSHAVSFGDILDFDETTTDITLLAWCKPEAETARATIAGRRLGGAYAYQFRIDPLDLETLFESGAVNSGLNTTLNAWNFCAMAVQSGSPSWRVNSSTSAAGSSVTYSKSAATTFSIGGTDNTGSYTNNFAGIINELQVHSVARPDEWIALEYDQTSDPATTWGTGTWNSGASGTTGTSAQTLPSLSQSASGSPINTGTSAQTLPSLTQSASGGGLIDGTSAQTLAGLSQAASGSPIARAALAQGLPTFEQLASGSPKLTAAIAETLPGLTQAASASIGSAPTGAASQTLGSLTEAASGSPRIAAALAQALPSLGNLASGSITLPGSIAQTLPTISQAARLGAIALEGVRAYSINRAAHVHTLRRGSHVHAITRSLKVLQINSEQ